MSMDLQDLQAVLREQADGTVGDSPDIDALLGRGRALRRRRRLVTGAATAVVVAAVVAIPVLVIGGSNADGGPARIIPAQTPTPAVSTPSPAASSPSPAPPTTTPTTMPTTMPVPSVSASTAPVVTTLVPPPPSSAPTSVAPPAVDSSILVYGDCRTPTFEPTQLILTCADHGFYFQDLHWTSWTATSATAVGTEAYNDCSPSCAGGQFHYIANATLTLTTPTTDSSGRRLWSQIAFSPQPPGYATGPYQGGPEPLPVRPT